MSLFFRRNSRHQKTLLFLEVVLLLIGFVSLGWATYKTGQRFFYASWEDYRFDQVLDGKEVSLQGYLKYLYEGVKPHAPEEQPAAENARPAPKARKLKRNELIGRVEIPRVKISAVVKEGADEATLSKAVGHVPYTSLPGEKGNVGIAAHRDTFFRSLRHVREGDTIRLVTTQGVYSYQVDTMRIVWPSNVEVLDPTPEERITLVTCYPFNFVGHAPKRFIVQGKLTGFEELTAKSQPPSSSSKSGM